MKIVICQDCKGVIAPKVHTPQWCECRKVECMYLENGVDLLLGGNYMVLAFDNNDVRPLIDSYKGGEPIKSWILPKDHPQLVKFKSAEPFGNTK